MLVIVYSRLPQPGRCKTRLIPAIGADTACRLQRAMTGHCLQQLRQARAQGHCALRVDHTGEADAMRSWLGDDLAFAHQADGDLGWRLQASFDSAFAAGHDAVCAVGCDVPAIRAHHIAAAAEALGRADVVMGPATDGGYWLIGARAQHHALWRDIPWGGDQVAAETRQRCADNSLELIELEQLADVDLPADLIVWEREGPAGMRAR